MHDPDLSEQQRLQESRAKARVPLDPAERRAELVVGGGGAVACALLWALPPVGGWSPLDAVVCGAAMLVAACVRFDVGGGYTVPAQIAFVPLMFTVPPQALPLVVAATLALARVPSIVRGQASPARTALCVGNSWFAIGSAAFLAATGGSAAIERHPALAAGLLASQFAADFVASAVREAVAGGPSLGEQLREAAWIYGVDTALTPAALWLAVKSGSAAVSVLVLMPIVALLASFAAERRKRLDGMFELNAAYHGTALLLGDVVEADDGYTGEHCRSVVELSLEVGRALDLSPDRLRNLEFGALLHDVGKIAVPKEIINKPGRLEPHEWEVIKTHTVEGQRMLDRVGGFMRDVGQIVRLHHERWDGGGYPDGLAGEAIPLEARIITVCDSYNAMTTDRAYRAAMPVEAALRELRAGAGTQFDPRVVDTLVGIVAPQDVPSPDEITLPADLAGSSAGSLAERPMGTPAANADMPSS